jgi:RNA polymerase sigma-70 factor (ECF subfamily)
VKTNGSQRVVEEYLVMLARGGSRDAFDELVRAFTPRLARFVARTLGASDGVRDVVQESWLAAVRGLRGLDDPARFQGWLYGIARRKCVDAIRGAQRARRLAESAREEVLATEHANLADRARQSERDLSTAIAGLNAEQREIVTLYYGDGLDVDELAVVLDVPVGTVKSRLFHARQAIKKLVGE